MDSISLPRYYHYFIASHEALSKLDKGVEYTESYSLHVSIDPAIINKGYAFLFPNFRGSAGVELGSYSLVKLCSIIGKEFIRSVVSILVGMQMQCISLVKLM